MASLLAILVALIIIGVIVWGIQKVLTVVPIPEPFRTILWVVVVIIAVIAFLQISGLYNFNLQLK